MNILDYHFGTEKSELPSSQTKKDMKITPDFYRVEIDADREISRRCVDVAEIWEIPENRCLNTLNP